MSEPMDVYSSSLDIPFDVAAFCRGHKFNITAVNLSRAIKARAEAQDLITKHEKQALECQKEINRLVYEIKIKIDQGVL